jgi:hypothetical protein
VCVFREKEARRASLDSACITKQKRLVKLENDLEAAIEKLGTLVTSHPPSL